MAGHNVVDAETYIETAIVQQPNLVMPLGLLPPDVADFTGRDAELARLEGELLAVRGQAVVISAVAGKPGVGKSALAVHLAHRLAGQFPDGQVYVNLRGADQQLMPAETALTELLGVLGVPGDQQPASLDGKAAVWRQRVAGKKVLVVVDNAHDEAQVRLLLPGSPTCAVIVTSRQVLATLGAKLLLLDILDTNEALRLLANIAGRERIEGDRQGALNVVAACGGLPLALRIAGAKLAARPDWPIALLAERLGDEYHRLAELGLGDLDVRASFQLSYQELPEQQARMFRLLALWPGSDFHPWAANSLLGAEPTMTEKLLDGLIAAQLVEPTGAPDRYRMHDLLRLFAREQLDHDEPQPGRDAARIRLLTAAVWLTDVLGAAVEQPGTRLGNEEMENVQVAPEMALGWLEMEREGLVALAGQTIQKGPWRDVWLLAEALNTFLRLRGYWENRERMNRWALQAARQAGDLGAEGRALNSLAMATADQGRWQEAIDYYEETLRIVRTGGDRHSEAAALTNLGLVLGVQGRWQEGIECHQRSTQMFQELADPVRMANSLGNLANILADQRRLKEATEHYKQALAIYREVGDAYGEAQALSNIGTIQSDQGYGHEAIDSFEQALGIFNALGALRDQAQVLGNLGLVQSRQDLDDQAIEHLEKALEIFRVLGDRYSEAQTLGNLGLALSHRGRLDDAIDCHRHSLELFRTLGAQQGAAKALESLGGLLADQERWQDAIDHYREALVIFRGLGDESAQGRALMFLGAALADQGNRTEAAACWKSALSILRSLDAPEAAVVQELLQEADQLP